MLTAQDGPSLAEMIAEYKEALLVEDRPLWLSAILVFFEYHPHPAWIKVANVSGEITMFRVNKAYEKAFGISSIDYELKSDAEIWGGNLPETATCNDTGIFKEKSVLHTDVSLHNPGTGNQERWVGCKWPVMRDGVVIAVCGMAVLDQETPCV